MHFKKIMSAAIASIGLAVLLCPAAATASDHDDGISRIKSRNRNITDIYAFREDNQTGRASDKNNLIVVMNTDPRAVAGRQEYFSTNAVYELNFSQVAASDKNATPTGNDDFSLRFMFGAPDQNRHQRVRLVAVRDGGRLTEELSMQGGGSDGNNGPSYPITTNLNESKAGKYNLNRFTFKNGQAVEMFAGLREDPFFFDVDQFFKVRAGAAGLGPKVGFRSPSKAVDFTVDYNVNTIVVRIPLEMLETPIVDLWGTVSVNGKQIERLARPAINEGLILTNAYLNAFNMIPPSADLSPAAAPVRSEAVKTLNAFDMLDGKIDIPAEKVVTAFLPDVMRIDTRVDIPVGKTAYNADLSGDKGILTGGRKLEDDVMDITLSLLVAGDATGQAVKDNVSYAGSNSHQGHSFLSGQKRRLGPAFFPFLAKPN